LRDRQAVRRRCQGAGHTERELAHSPIRHVLQADKLNEVIHARSRNPLRLRLCEQVVVGGATRMHGARFEEHSDIAQRCSVRRVALAVDRCGPARRGMQPQDQTHDRRLPGAVGPEESSDHAWLNGEGQAVDRGLLARQLVALDVGNVYVTDQRLRIQVPCTRTGLSRTFAIPRGEHPDICPVRAIRAWYAMSGIRSGALFRPIDRHGRVGATRLTARAVALVIKRAARRAGVDPTRYAGHSLRAGLVTATTAGGAPERVILAQTGLHSLSSMPRYMRRASRLDREAAAYLGL